jgi:hypothetical protein
MRNYHNNNKDNRNEYMRNYYDKNKDKYKGYVFKYFRSFRGKFLYLWEVLSQGKIYYAGSTKCIKQRYNNHYYTKYGTDFAEYITDNKISKDDLRCYALDLSRYDIDDDDLRLLERYMIQTLKANNPLINEAMSKTKLYPKEQERLEELLSEININNFVLYEELIFNIEQKNTYPSVVETDDKWCGNAV